MEFGIFIQGHQPGQDRAHDPWWEHDWVRREVELIEEADRHNWKYVWLTEHHFLEEYSHLSDSATFAAWSLARTTRIHIGSGLFNTNPIVNHPVRTAERVAMLDQLSQGRFEFGTGRGAGSHELGGFGLDPSETKAAWDEVVREFPKMWNQQAYDHDGDVFSVPETGTWGTFNVLPKPYVHTHPAMWVAAGNPATYEKAASYGLGVLGFNVGTVYDMEPLIETYKAQVDKAEPVGDFVNDNVMITNALLCLEDGGEAREQACDMGMGYLQSLVFRYHDTFPKPDRFPSWPEVLPEPTLDDIEGRIEAGYLLCGDPDEVLEQAKKYESVGCDQLCFGLPMGMPHEAALETLRLFGDHVIPEIDTDPKHRTTAFREAAGGPLTLPDEPPG